MQDSVEQLASSIRGSQALRLLSVGLLALLLQIPIGMIGRLVSERQERRQGAVAEVSLSATYLTASRMGAAVETAASGPILSLA